MYYYLYKITNLLNDNFYIGRRMSLVPPNEDLYFGSGKRLKAAIKKHGRENFKKEILSEYTSELELIESEKNIVNYQLVKNVKCYNLAVGGYGGYTYYAERVVKHTEESKAKISKANKGRKRPDVAIKNKNNTFALGLVRSRDDKLKKSVAAHNRLQYNKTEFNTNIVCPHCNKVGQQANMMRWHFDKCRSNPRNITTD